MVREELEELVAALIGNKTAEGVSAGRAANELRRLMGAPGDEQVAGALGEEVQKLLSSQAEPRAEGTGLEANRPAAPVLPTVADQLAAVSSLASAKGDPAETLQQRYLPAARVASEKGQSAGTQVLKTIGLLTGAGPVVTGLLSLFGRGRKSRPEDVQLPLYDLPSSINVSAGLQADRSLTGVTYGAFDQVRTQRPEAPAAAPSIQVNVQALDSRSFLDHSADIAAAVRKAVLQSNALNDVVSEL